LERWQWDMSYAVIKLLVRAGLASKLKLPPASVVELRKTRKGVEVAS
jgi:hypothetical protein